MIEAEHRYFSLICSARGAPCYWPNPGQQGQAPLAALTKYQFPITQAVAQHGAYFARYDIAGILAEAVVETLEMINVDHQAAHRLIGALRVRRTGHATDMGAKCGS